MENKNTGDIPELESLTDAADTPDVLKQEEYEPLGEFAEIIGVRFRKAGKIYFFDPAGFTLSHGEKVIVETSRGVEIGWVETPNRVISSKLITPPLKKLIRTATQEDLEQERQNADKERESFDIALEKIQKHNLDMKLVDVEFTFDLSKIIFYFTSDGRVDFRELVKELAYVFRTRIELRQVGVRDEAKILNGIGICGRALCCATFLDEFQPVSIKMAKDQNLSLNPTKISGVCGRLMCCLKYEESTYEHLNKGLPELGSFVITPEGSGEVLSVSVLRQLVRVAVRKKPSDPPTVMSFPVTDVRSSKEPDVFKEYREKKAQQADELRLSKLAASEIITPVVEESGGQINTGRNRRHEEPFPRSEDNERRVFEPRNDLRRDSAAGFAKRSFREKIPVNPVPILDDPILDHVKPDIAAIPIEKAADKTVDKTLDKTADKTVSKTVGKRKTYEKQDSPSEREFVRKPYYMKPFVQEKPNGETSKPKTPQKPKKQDSHQTASAAEKQPDGVKPVRKTASAWASNSISEPRKNTDSGRTPISEQKTDIRKKNPIPAPQVENVKKTPIPAAKTEIPKDIAQEPKPKKRQWRFRTYKAQKKNKKDD